MQSNQIESHLLQSNLISSNLIYLGTAINCGTSILLLKGVGLVENRNTKCIFGGLGGGWGGGANNDRTCCVHVMQNIGFTETIPTSFITSLPGFQIHHRWSPTESMEWMINCCLLDDATWESIMHCSSCSPCRLLTSPIFFKSRSFCCRNNNKMGCCNKQIYWWLWSCNGKGGLRK